MNTTLEHPQIVIFNIKWVIRLCDFSKRLHWNRALVECCGIGEVISTLSSKCLIFFFLTFLFVFVVVFEETKFLGCFVETHSSTFPLLGNLLQMKEVLSESCNISNISNTIGHRNILIPVAVSTSILVILS